MDRADFEAVVAIARAGSLTGAAQQLHIAQPPLSRRLQQLEREVGAPLFRRGRHGAIPTPAGRALIDAAGTALAAIARAEQDAVDAAGGRSGRLRIGVTPTLGSVLLPAVLGAFRRSHPDVRLDLTASGDSADLRRQVGHGDVDLALAARGNALEPNTTVALKGSQHFVLIAPTDLGLPKAVRRRALVDLPIVAISAGEGLREQLDHVLAELDREPNISIETSEREMLVPFVAAGLGVALVPEGFARARPARGLAIHDLVPPVRREIAVFVPTGDAPLLVRAFLDALEAGTDLTRATAPRAQPRRTRSRGR
jgi:DNA-binding transcriptional LysR family regulator